MQKRLLLLLLVIVSVNCSLIAQPFIYNFNGDLTGSGPTLTEQFSCGATKSLDFTAQTITTTCPSSPTQPAYNFDAGGGVAFSNDDGIGNGLIGDTYTISFLFRFNALSGWQRLVDFSNGVLDNGAYTFDDCPLIPGGPGATTTDFSSCPLLIPGTFHLITLVRGDGSANLVSLYVDGVLHQTTTDVNDLYHSPAPTTPIIFFIDDAGDCEDRDGSIRYLSISPLASDAATVTTTWNAICATVLPLHLLDFSADKENSSVALNWATENELNTSHFEVERGADGRTFTKLSDISALSSTTSSSTTRRNYNFVDRQPLPGTGFYRLKMLDMDGHFKYSGILKINFSGSPQFEVYPNPVKDVITIGGIRGNGNIRLINAEGRQVLQKISAGQSMTVDVSKYPSGIYVVLYSDGEKTQSQKILKE
jgi:Secretion system C-terminal sorting domain